MRRQCSLLTAGLLVAGGLFGLGGEEAPAQVEMTFVRSRPVVMSYRVEPDGFVLPVTGIVTEGITFRSHRSSPEPARITYLINRRSEGSPASRPAAVPTPTESPTVPVAASPRPSLRTTTLFGTIRKGEDGKLTLLVEEISRQVIYALETDAPARKLLEAAGTDSVSAILIGKVSDDDPAPILRVEKALPVAQKTASLSPY